VLAAAYAVSMIKPAEKKARPCIMHLALLTPL
jgi:hypothetical protein